MYVHACVAVLLELMMSVLQEINDTFHYTFQEEVHFPCKILGQLFTCFTCFDISKCIVRTDNHNFFQEVKGLTEKIIYLCTRSEENLFVCQISSLVLLRLLSYASS